MELENFSSKLLKEAVDEFAKLPGIGRKTALRLVLHLLNREKEEVNQFGNTIIKLRSEIKRCKSCNVISDNELCPICSDSNRDHSLVCVVENSRDVMAIESTHQYQGIYHVLGGIISPMDGIGPGDLNIENLHNKIEDKTVQEIVLALSTTMEGDTTNFFLYKRFRDYPVKITTIARGISVGNDLEFADELTLGKSIVNRTLFENTLSSQ
ncbi:MAG: recombination mediator RecR [Bacteroidales bacterium]|nr:recombination mediator RecR [Bacteroidales bacterium]MBS3774463.1 recombination mediator RecR [Bacteroidales bacterium]